MGLGVYFLPLSLVFLFGVEYVGAGIWLSLRQQDGCSDSGSIPLSLPVSFHPLKSGESRIYTKRCFSTRGTANHGVNCLAAQTGTRHLMTEWRGSHEWSFGFTPGEAPGRPGPFLSKYGVIFSKYGVMHMPETLGNVTVTTDASALARGSWRCHEL